MHYQATKKVPGGKLLRVKVRTNESAQSTETITDIQISGDFFLHPEESLPAIEKNLIGLPKNGAQQLLAAKIRTVLSRQHAAFIGVTPEDIAQTINEATSPA